MTRTENERLAVLETQMQAVLKHNEEAAEDRRKTRESVERIEKTLAGSKMFRLGLLTALPIGSGGIGAAIMKWLGSGGPTGTH